MDSESGILHLHLDCNRVDMDNLEIPTQSDPSLVNQES